jgi:zinc protease
MLETARETAHEFFLDNGLKVVFVPQIGAPVATVLIVYRIGSRNEGAGYTGSSHLLEHMLFKGTPANNRRRGRAFADIMNEIGANKNATTWLDRTNYFETVPAGYLDFALELEADRMRNALIADEDRRSEMTVVRNELERSDNNSMRALHTALVATAFREHPYHHPTIGWRPDVEGVSTERLRELYDTYYGPGNATAFVVGDFDPERTRATIERSFGALPPAPAEVPDVYTDEPPQAGERSVVVKRPGDAAIVALAFHTPAAFGQTHVLSNEALARASAGGTPAGDDGEALDVLARILGRGRTSRLSRALVDTGMALEVSASNWGSRDPGLFEIVANVRPGVDPGDVRRELETALGALASSAPEALEVERAQNQITVARAFSREGTLSLAQRLGELEAVGSWRLDEGYIDRIRAITPERVRDVAQTYLHEDNRTLGLLVPGTPKTFDFVPFEPVEAVRDVFAAVEAEPLPAPRASSPLRFESRIASAELANGLAWKYVESPHSPTMHVRGLFLAGPAFARENPMLAAITAEMLSRGTRAHGRREIEERLERTGIRRTYYVDDDRTQSYDTLVLRFSAAAAAADAELLFASLAEELREPAFDEAELEAVKAEITGGLRLARTDTGWRATQRFTELLYPPGDANREPDVDALLEAVAATDVAMVRHFHERFVLGTAPLVSGAGAHPVDRFADFLSGAFASVPFAGSLARLGSPIEPSLGDAPAERRANVELERKANVDIVIGRATALVRSDADYLASVLANGILGQSTLSSRLGLRLRDREGLTYGVTSAFLSAARLPGPWRVSVSVNPANVERAIDLVRDVLGEYVSDGPSAREVAQQRNSMAGQHAVALATNGGIAAQLERIAYFRLGDDYVDTYRDRLQAISLGDVAQAARRYLGDRDLAVVAAGTFTR